MAGDVKRQLKLAYVRVFEQAYEASMRRLEEAESAEADVGECPPLTRPAGLDMTDSSSGGGAVKTEPTGESPLCLYMTHQMRKMPDRTIRLLTAMRCYSGTSCRSCWGILNPRVDYSAWHKRKR